MNAIRAALVLGLAGSLSMLVACGSKQEQPQLVANAGKVTEIAGAVIAMEAGGKARPLAANDYVDADDTIVTGVDGRVVIVLAHNHARWELGPNLSRKVRTSTAWSLPKGDGTAKHVEQDTASAGRPAEREAAGTTASASAEGARAAEPAPAAAIAPPPPPDEKHAEDSAGDKPASPPAPGGGAPPPAKNERAADDDVVTKGGTADTATAKASPATAKTAPNPITIAGQILRENQTSIAACLERDGASATVILHVGPKQAITVDITGRDISAAAKTCMIDVVTKLAKQHARFPKLPLDVSVDVTK